MHMRLMLLREHRRTSSLRPRVPPSGRGVWIVLEEVLGDDRARNDARASAVVVLWVHGGV